MHEEKLEEDQIVSFWGCFPDSSSAQVNSTMFCYEKIHKRPKRKGLLLKEAKKIIIVKHCLRDSKRFTHMIGVEWKCKRALKGLGWL